MPFVFSCLQRMDRLVLVNFLFVAAGTGSPLDFLVWLPIVLQPTPTLAILAHASLVIYACTVAAVGADRDINLILPIGLGIVPPLLVKK